MRLNDQAPFMQVDLQLPDRREGKVRVSYQLPGGRRLFVTTDRLSAFDRIIAGVPYKGQVLNQMAAWWFANTSHIVPNHVVSVPDPNLLVARDARPLPVEVIVRGYITGVTSTSLWKQYADGAREIYGHHFADGMTKNAVLANALVTPTTKAEQGEHDEPLSVADVVGRNLVDAKLWGQTVEAALELFRHGQQVAAKAGLILADTKYEFGLDSAGQLMLIDEMHTPDSSRYWIADSYQQRINDQVEPESLDKEVVRRALLDAGYQGDGSPPQLADEVWHETSRRYITAYEMITGQSFTPGAYPVGPRITEVFAHGSN